MNRAKIERLVELPNATAVQAIAGVVAAAAVAAALVVEAAAAVATVRMAIPAAIRTSLQAATKAVVRMEPTATTRVDRWLWSVRLFKTRTLAARACSAGHVRVNGQAVKPSRALRPGDMVNAHLGPITRTVKVLAALKRRVGAKAVSAYLEDLTPQSEYQKPREQQLAPKGLRPKGAGRPTKRERRVLTSFFGED